MRLPAHVAFFAGIERDSLSIDLPERFGACQLQVRVWPDVILERAKERAGALPKLFHGSRVAASLLDAVRHDDHSELELDSAPIHCVPLW